MLLTTRTSQTMSIRGEGHAGHPGGEGQPGGRGQAGGKEERVVREGPSTNDQTRHYDSGNSAVRGHGMNGTQDRQSEGDIPGVRGGAGTGGSAHGGHGGQGGSGGHGGVGGSGGDGGRASARAEAYASVYTFMMCCVQTPPKQKAQRPRPTLGSVSSGATGPASPPDGPIVGAVPEGWQGLPGEDGRQAEDRLRREYETRIYALGGTGRGGHAGGGRGGHGGRGGLGGRGGQGGTGGQGSAHASASTPIYPRLMCCVLVRPYD